MKAINDTLIKNLQEFDLSKEEAVVYSVLQQYPSSSSYRLHKLTGINRGKLEGILKVLIGKQLVTEAIAANGQKDYVAHPFKNLASLIELKHIESKNMQSALDQIMQANLFTDHTNSSDILHYTGIDGLKQVLWNALRTQGEMLVFEVSRLSAFMQKSFAEKWREEVLHRGFTIKDLTNQSYMAGWTDVAGFPAVNEVRYIDPKVLEIQFEIYIYNDVVTMLEYKDKVITCIEVHNKYLAMLQRQLFEYVWKDATPMKYVGPRGEMRISE